MKKYTPSRYCWVTLSVALLGVYDMILGLVHALQGKGWAASLPWEIFAVCCGGIAFFLYWKGERIHPVDVKPFEESQEYIHYLRGKDYAMKEELVRKQRYVERLKLNQKDTVRWAIWGGLCGLIGAVLFGIAIPDVKLTNKAVAKAWFSLTYPCLLLGATMVIAGFRMIWITFINADNKLAFYLADKYTLDTYPMKIFKENILIGVISKRLEQEKAEEQRKREERLRKEKEMMEELASIPLDLDLRG
ncbi:MAG: hypothetical protein K6F51_03045 [Acetatifactor sp.]|nr:hypothetical protein [Acetatifactor sp.]